MAFDPPKPAPASVAFEEPHTAPDSENDHKLKQPFWGFGILCCILSGAIYSFNAMLVKLLESVGGIQLSASRCFVQFFMILPFVTYNWNFKSVDVFGPSGMFKFLILRGFSGSTGMICLYQAIQRISVGDAVTIQFSHVVFTGVMGYCILGESLTLLDGLLSLVAMIGIVFIAKPPFLFGGLGVAYNLENYIGVIFALCTAIMTGCSIVLLRKLGQPTHVSLNILYYSFNGYVVTFFVIFISNSFKMPCLHELPYIFLIGVTGIAGQIFMTVALHYERAGTYAVLRSFQIVIVFILQIFILGDYPSYLSLIGATLVFASVFGIASRKLYNIISSQRIAHSKAS